VEGGGAVVLHRDLAATAASLEEQARGDGDGWRAFAEPLLEHFAAVRDTMLSGFPPLGGPLKLLARGGPVTTARFAGLLPGSAAGLARRLFSGPGSRAWLLGAAMHGDVPPDRPGSAIAGAYLNLLGHAVGWPSPEGGAGRLTDALVGYLRSLGGEVRCGARVVRVVSRGGAVAGVELAGGERVDASLVIGDLMPRALLTMAGDDLPWWYRRLLGRYTYGPATVKVDWALDAPIPWEADTVRSAGTVHLAGSEEAFFAALDGARDGFSPRPFLLLGQQSIADPTRAPEGKHTAWAYTHGPQQGVDWTASTPIVAERMEEQVERFAPGFRDRILARHVLGPADLEARNPNLVGGDVGGGSYRLRQVVFRPIPKLTPYSTPVKGLFIGSAATFPGGAVHGVPGDAAARAALK